MTTMINFIAPKSQESAELVKWRRRVKAITTAVLVMWIVVSAGFFGWWVFMKSKTTQVSSEMESLMAQVAEKSQEEIVVRKLDLRVKAVNEFLDNRGDILKKIGILAVATPEAVEWKYDRAGDEHKAVIQVDTTAEAETYMETLKAAYKNVRISSLVWSHDDIYTGWTATIIFSGLEI